MITLDLEKILVIVTLFGTYVVGSIAWILKVAWTAQGASHRAKLLFNFKDEHEKDSAEWRSKYEREMAELRGQLAGLIMANGKEFAAILERLDRMEDSHQRQFEKLEDKIDKLEDRRKD